MFKNSNNIKKRLAFTLAEILIVLGIIGGVAALTIPSMMNNIQDLQYKTAYKKAYSVAMQAWTQAVTDGNIVERTSWTEGISRIQNFNAFKSNFKVVKDCDNNNNGVCWATGDMYWINTPLSAAPAFIDSNGMAWSSLANLSDNIRGAEIVVDVNGFNKPNKYGQDRFIFIPVVANANISNFSALFGMPVKIVVYSDYTSKDIYVCPSGDSHPCYYTKWLYN